MVSASTTPELWPVTAMKAAVASASSVVGKCFAERRTRKTKNPAIDNNTQPMTNNSAKIPAFIPAASGESERPKQAEQAKAERPRDASAASAERRSTGRKREACQVIGS